LRSTAGHVAESISTIDAVPLGVPLACAILPESISLALTERVLGIGRGHAAIQNGKALHFSTLIRADKIGLICS
jgi:hypothetical protein